MRDGQHQDSPQADDWRDIALESNCVEAHPEQFLLTQKAYLNRLRELHLNGVTFANMLVLMRTWSQGAAVHILRHVSVKVEWTQAVDNQITSAIEQLLEVTLDDRQKRISFSTPKMAASAWAARRCEGEQRIWVPGREA